MWVGRAILVVVLVWLSLLYAQKTNLTASDLGRHLMNGQVIWTEKDVFTTNYYSYTHPDFPVPNHHWLFGVLAYGVYQISGFTGLSLIGIMLSMTGVGIVVHHLLSKHAVPKLVVAAGVLMLMPILVDRAEIRPEAVSLVFISLLTTVTWNWIQSKRTAFPWMLLVVWVISMIIWVNTHIFFIFAAVILGSAGMHLLVNTQWKKFRDLLIIAGCAVASTLINPLGLSGVLYPFTIFSNYEYRVAENQSIWFFLKHYLDGYYAYLAVVVWGTLGILFAQRARNPKHTAGVYWQLLLAFFAVLTSTMMRYESIFALMALLWFCAYGWPLLYSAMTKIAKNIPSSLRLSLNSFFLAGCGVLWLSTAQVFPVGPSYGLGLLPNNRASADFFRSLDVQGNVFNNYDIGGFLIFELFPDRKVFTDNRPEAYPPGFLSNVLIEAQLNDTVWESISKQYDIGAIFFNRHDLTEWGQRFMIARLEDERWIPIFVDDYTIIFVDDRPENSSIIEAYRLSDDHLNVREN